MRTFSDRVAPGHLAWAGLVAELALCGPMGAVAFVDCFEFLEGRSSLASYSALFIYPP